MNNLSVDYGVLGRRDEGLAAIEETVEVYRRLAAADPAAHEPDLAMSVHNLSIRLGEVGRQDEGLAAIEEAIEVYRPMAVAIPEVFAGRLRTAQATRASLLDGLGRSEEAREIRRRLADEPTGD